MRLVSLTLLCLVISLSTVATAKPKPAKNWQANQIIGKKQAAHLVKQKYPGKLLKIKDANKHYKVRVLQPKGRVLDVTVNKKSGFVKKGKH